MDQFDLWMSDVDRRLTERIGLTSWDLPDRCYMSDFEAGYSALDTAEATLEELEEDF
jgi:hypothetical protein